MRALLPILLAGLLSCSTPSFLQTPLTFVIDPAFPSPQPFEDAARRWNLYVSHDKRITIADDGAWRIYRQDPQNGYNGGTWVEQRWIRIAPGADPYLTVMHEFGHALGLGHTAHGVMDPEHATDVFSDEDLDECRRVGACE